MTVAMGEKHASRLGSRTHRADRPLASPPAQHGHSHHELRVPYNPHVGKIFDPAPSTFHVRGAKADIQELPADLCTSGNGTDSSAWVGVGSDDGNGYAQIGYLNKNTGSVFLRFFWEWVKDIRDCYPIRLTSCDFAQSYFGTPYFLTTDNFKVSRTGTGGHLHMYLNSSQPGPNQGGVAAETDFDPVSTWGSMQNGYSAETQYTGDDVPGDINEKDDFTNIMAKDENNVWSVQGFTATVRDECYFRIDTLSDSHIKTYTEPINHNC